MHPQQQPTPQTSQIPGQHVAQGPVMTMAYFVQQQQTYPTPPHAQQAIGNRFYFGARNFVKYLSLRLFQPIQELQWV